MKTMTSQELLLGTYKAENAWYSSIHYDGKNYIINGTDGTETPIDIVFGDFGIADPKIQESTGQTAYNLEIKYSDMEITFTEVGVISEDRLRMTLKEFL